MKIWTTLFGKYAKRTLLTGLLIGSLGSIAQAGNVQVSLEGALLKIVGDNAADSIIVSQNAASDVTIRGLDGTTINGRPSVVFRRAQLNAAEMNMGGGDDTVNLRGLVLGNDLFVNLDAGNDRLISALPVNVGANFTVTAGAGNDVVRLTDTVVGEDCYIEGGIGSLNTTLTGMDVGKSLTVISDEANDNLSVTNTIAGGYFSFESKGGADRITASGLVGFGLAIQTDMGSDRVSVSDSLIQEDAGVFTGTQNDIVDLVNLAVNKSLVVSVDAGDDSVSGSGLTVAEDAVFEGGAGTDTLTDLGITGGIKKDIKEFEIVLP